MYTNTQRAGIFHLRYHLHFDCNDAVLTGMPTHPAPLTQVYGPATWPVPFAFPSATHYSIRLSAELAPTSTLCKCPWRFYSRLNGLLWNWTYYNAIHVRCQYFQTISVAHFILKENRQNLKTPISYDLCSCSERTIQCRYCTCKKYNILNWVNEKELSP